MCLLFSCSLHIVCQSVCKKENLCALEVAIFLFIFCLGDAVGAVVTEMHKCQ